MIEDAAVAVEPYRAAADSILIGAELARRPVRPPDFAAESEALHSLARLLIDDPKALPKRLAEIALDLCHAGSAGVSLLEEGPRGAIFRWTALAGQFAPYEGGSTPRDFSPCGLCLDRGEAVLVAQPAQRFRYFDKVGIPITEGLVVPLFGAGKRPLGTLWIVSHSTERQFDREDLRVMKRLADFTALAIECSAAHAEVKEGDRRARELLEALPAAIYTTDASGRITYYNQAAVELAGRRPRLGHDEWCLTWRLYRPDGSPMPHDECPMAVTLKEGRPVRGEEALAERPDGTRVAFIPHPTPLRDRSGAIVGAVNMLVDITEGRRAEEALRASEERLRAIFNSTALGVAILTPAARFIQINGAFCDLTGYSHDELLTLDYGALTHPDDRAPMHEQINALLAGEMPSFVLEKRYLRKDGGLIWVQNSVSLTRDAAGQPLHLVVVSQDVTDRKAAERALCEGRENLTAALTASDTGTFRWNPHTGEFLEFDANLKRLFGFAPDEPVELTEDFIARVHPDDLAALLPAVDACRGGADFSMEYRVVLPGGGIRWLYERAKLARDNRGKPSHLVGACTDITKRKQAEEVLRDSQERLATELAATQRLQEISGRLIGEGDVEALYDQILDAAVGIMRSDMASMQMLDPARGDLRLLAYRGFDAASAARWERVSPDSYSSCAAALRAGRRVVVPDIATCDFLVGTPGFEAYRDAGIAAMQSTPLLSRSGRLLGMISTHWTRPHQPPERDLRLFEVLARQAADLIERTHAEAQLRDLNESLERRIAERTRELQDAMAERRKVETALQQARHLEAIGQLTGGVAHDFNNLLTVIAGQSEGIAAAARDDDTRRRAAAIQRAAERGARLTSQLLAFSRRQRLSPQRVTIGRLMADIDDLVRRAVGETVMVAFSADPDLWPSLVDPAQFESAILNLAINAKDAMPDGGHLAIAARNAAVDAAEALRLDIRPGDYVVVSVADTGTGMPADIRDRAFEPFFTTKDVGKGTGLGLAQIYGFVRQSGGAVALESTLGKGTTVFLHLPRAQADPAAELALPSEPVLPRAGAGKTILVVEDQPDVREVIESSLSDLGYRILTASDGIEARQMLDSSESIDLLLTDLVMPNGVSGLDLVEGARRLRPNLKSVLVSGYSRDARIRAGSLRGGFTFLEKPFRQAELADRIAAALAAGRG